MYELVHGDYGSVLRLRYDVQASDLDTALVVKSVGLVSRPRVGDTYRLDEVVEAAVRFDKAPYVIGVPALTLDVGGKTTMRRDGQGPHRAGRRPRSAGTGSEPVRSARRL